MNRGRQCKPFNPLFGETEAEYPDKGLCFFCEKGRIEAVDSNGHLRSCPSDLGGIVRGRWNRSYGRLAGYRRIRVGSWNVGSLTRKFFELGDVLRRHKVDIACFQETKWKGSRAREGNGYKLWYSGSSIARNGVGIILAGRHKDNVVRVTRRGDRIMAISVVIEGETVNVISAYAPQVGLSDADKKRFWDALDEMVRECPTNQRLIIGGDLNGHIGAAADGYAEVHGGFGFGDRNEEGCTVLEFATAYDLKLDSKEGVNEIYKIAKARERRRSDIGNVKYIKDEGGRTIVREENIRTRWGEYFSSLFNETPSEESRPEGSGEVGRSSSPAHFDCYYSRINHGEVRAALRKMGRNKAVGLDQIPIEAWRGLGDEGVKWLTCL
nr:craniofacial development protein 2-like [Tanacetum cinerariifolium]